MRARLLWTTVGTAVVGAALVVTAVAVLPSPSERREVRTAERIGTTFLRELPAQDARMAASVEAAHQDDPDDYTALLRTIDDLVKTAPQVPKTGTTAYGRRHSHTYRRALERRALTLGRYRGVASHLRDQAVPQAAFVGAARSLLRLNPTTLVGSEALVDGGPLRERVLPAYEKARSALRRQDPPPGAELLQRDLDTYAADAIAMTRDGARALDRGEPFFFSFGDRPAQLNRQLPALVRLVERGVAEQIDVLVNAGA